MATPLSTPSTIGQTARLDTIDHLRGLAAVIVCFNHLGHALPPFIEHSITSPWGRTGVQIFFVISGFIIPYSLFRGKYTIGHCGQFLWKRFLRLYPPFFLALLFTFLASTAAATIKSAPPVNTPLEWIKSALLLMTPGENPVFWSLGVEAVYYLFIGLTFPLLFAAKRSTRLLSFGACAILGLLCSNHVPMTVHLPFFLAGFAVCYWALGMESRFVAATLACASIALAFPFFTAPKLVAGVFAVVALCSFIPFHLGRAGKFFGDISYSFYLIHFPIAVKIVNLAQPKLPAYTHPLLMCVAFAVAVLVAFLMYKVIEVPATRWSQKIKYSTR